jgi:DNA-binding transcriptional LysR family regulator
LKKNKLKVDIRMELGSNEAIKEAVAGGLGIGIISQHALHGHRKENGVTVLPVKGFPILSQWHIVHHVKKQLSPIAQGFKQHLLKNVRSQLS